MALALELEAEERWERHCAVASLPKGAEPSHLSSRRQTDCPRQENCCRLFHNSRGTETQYRTKGIFPKGNGIGKSLQATCSALHFLLFGALRDKHNSWKQRLIP